jgi:hypothetical protein
MSNYIRCRPGGEVVSVLATGPKGHGLLKHWIFKGDKNLQHTFLWMGTKAEGPIS